MRFVVQGLEEHAGTTWLVLKFEDKDEEPPRDDDGATQGELGTGPWQRASTSSSSSLHASSSSTHPRPTTAVADSDVLITHRVVDVVDPAHQGQQHGGTPVVVPAADARGQPGFPVPVSDPVADARGQQKGVPVPADAHGQQHRRVFRFPFPPADIS